MKLWLMAALVFAALMSGCAGGHNYDYSITPIDPHIKGKNEAVTLGVYDQRDYVKNGEKFPQYVGTQRTPAYVPWNINTKSGLPMADDFLVSIKRALERDGYIVHDVSLPENENRTQVLARLEKTGDKRILLFTINEWYFDAWTTVRMEYSLQLEVLNSECVVLARVEIGKKMWEESDNAVPDTEFKTAVEELLTDSHVTMALNKDVAPYAGPVLQKSQAPKELSAATKVKADPAPEKTTETNAPCTTDQILKMKNMGMSDQQIKAACR